MFLLFRLPKTLLWVFHVAILYVLLLTFFRLLTFLLFHTGSEAVADLFHAFFLGLRFDLRWISLLLLPVVLAGAVPALAPFTSSRNKQVWTWYLALSTFCVLLIYAIDFGCFSYFRVRLGATVINFADDTAIALQMLWQMYPLFWMVAALLTVVLATRAAFLRLHRSVATLPVNNEASTSRTWFILFPLLLVLFVYGSFPEPLRWNAAFRQNADFSGYLSLNPLQSVYSTLDNRKPQFDTGKVKEAYPLLQRWMKWKEPGGGYKQSVVPAANTFRRKPNVVLVVCESFSMYKTSISGNPLNTTPYFNTLRQNGLFFERCFSPHFSTARGMFAILTGIPDVQLAKFSTRTEAVESQHTIINDFTGYSKFYFLGGSPAFNNFEGLMKNVKGVQMKTEGSFASKAIDVWGISDKALFLEANKVFAKQTEPFFAVIQTADNHPPYSIANEDKDFVRREVEPEQLKKFGFESPEQYNAMRYFDYSVQKFMEAAKKEVYFDNTLFVFVGDHGVAGDATMMYQPEWTENRITEMHVPLLFYAPAHLPAGSREDVVSQIDVLPTIAGITGQPHTNSTLGRNLVNRYDNHSAFFIRHDEGEIGVLTDDFYFTKNIRFQKEALLPLNRKKTYPAFQLDSVQKELSGLTSAYWETARWMLVNNQP